MLKRSSSWIFPLKYEEYHDYKSNNDLDVLFPLGILKIADFYEWSDKFLSYTPEIFAVADFTEGHKESKYHCIRAWNKKDAIYIKLVWR